MANSAVVIRVDPANRKWWKDTLYSLLPGFSVFLWDEDRENFDLSELEYAVVWAPPHGMLASLPNLRAVFSVGAGVTHILNDDSFPSSVPIVRCVNADLRHRMVEYVLLHSLGAHRRLASQFENSELGEWKQYVEPLARDRQIGLLGTGNLGSACGAALRSAGFKVVGWSRSGKPVEGIEVSSGRSGLESVLSSSDVVVSLLPGTQETLDLLGANEFALMKSTATLINVGRGETVVDEALLRSLDRDELRFAVLDVFRDEPLPSDSPFWHHRKVLVTCHTASAIEPATGGRTIADSILAFDRDGRCDFTVDAQQGY